MKAYAGEDVEYGEYSLIASGIANLYSNFRNQYGGLSENFESNYLKTQQYPSCAHTQKMPTHATRSFALLHL